MKLNRMSFECPADILCNEATGCNETQSVNTGDHQRDWPIVIPRSMNSSSGEPRTACLKKWFLETTL